MRAFLFSLFVMFSMPLAEVSAMQVNPLVIEMESVGSRSRGNISISNPSNRPLPVEFEIQRFKVDSNGDVVILGNGEDDFLIFPPQAIVQPFGRQNVRVQWLGNPDIAASEHFYIVAKQVPVEVDRTQKVFVQIVFNIRTMVNVKPPIGDPALSVSASGIESDEKGQRRIWATINNASSVHAALGQSTLRLSALDGSGAVLWSINPNASQRGSRIGVGLVPAKGSRRYVFPFEIPADVAARATAARVEITARRPR